MWFHSRGCRTQGSVATRAVDASLGCTFSAKSVERWLLVMVREWWWTTSDHDGTWWWWWWWWRGCLIVPWWSWFMMVPYLPEGPNEHFWPFHQAWWGTCFDQARGVWQGAAGVSFTKNGGDPNSLHFVSILRGKLMAIGLLVPYFQTNLCSRWPSTRGGR